MADVKDVKFIRFEIVGLQLPTARTGARGPGGVVGKRKVK